MMCGQFGRLLLASACALALTACGGGGGVQTALIPTPPVTPAPAPPAPAPPPPPSPPAQIGLVSAAPFTVLSIGEIYTTDSTGNHAALQSGPSAQDVQFSYSAATNSYQISLPGFQPGSLTDTSYGGGSGQPATSSGSHVTLGSSAVLQPVIVTLFVPGAKFSPYTYTSFGIWSGQTGTSAGGDIIRQEGTFAYGIPTPAGDVPITGSASYSAQIIGTDLPGDLGYPGSLSGTANLTFDFAGGMLSGSMNPIISFNAFDGTSVGKYDFTQTVYSTGSTTFSGKFIVPGLPNADSMFQGNFTGPGAVELMARFQAPYLFNGQQGTMSGVWIGKKN